MKFAALGRTHWLLDAMDTCADRGHEPVLIGTCAAAPEYRVDVENFAAAADRYSCDYFCDVRINRPEYLHRIENSGAEVALSVNWAGLLQKPVLSAFHHGVVNAHAGDLPRYRGNACPNWAILNGESHVVLTLHRMVPELDAGPILLQSAMPLTEETYIADIYAYLDATVPVLMADLLDGLEDGSVSERPQSENPADAMRCFPRRPEDSLIDWSATAVDVCRVVRAGSEPFSGAYTHLEGERLTVWRAHAEALPFASAGHPGQVVERRPDGSLVVLTGKGVVVLEEVETVEGSRGLPARIVKSTRSRLGLNVHQELERLRSEVAALSRRLELNSDHVTTEGWNR